MTDNSGAAYTTDTQVKGEVDNGINDPDEPDSATYNTPDYTCQTTNTGQCTITVTQADLELGTASICFWIETDNVGSEMCTDDTQGTDPNEDELTSEGAVQDGSDTGNDQADRVEKTWADRVAAGVDAEPETDTNTRGDNHTITATVYDQFGSQDVPNNQVVNFEFFTGSPADADGNTPASPDDTCNTGTGSSCQIQYTQGPTESGGVDLVCVWIGAAPTMAGSSPSGTCNAEDRDDADDTAGSADAPEPSSDRIDVVEKIWEASRLDCEPETATRATGDTHEITCTARDANNNTVPGINIDAEVTGANDPDAEDGDSPTTTDLTCTTGNLGTCTLLHGPDGTSASTSPGPSTYRIWIDLDKRAATTESDATEARDEAAEGGAGATAEPDDTDVTEATWVQTSLDCVPETEETLVGTSHEVDCTATATGASTEGLTIAAEATGANDADNANGGAADFTCTTDSSGFCSFSHGPGANTGTTTYRAWVESDDAAGGAEADAAETRTEADADATDVVETEWTNSAMQLSLDPDEDTNEPGTTQTLTATVTDNNGQPVQGAAVDWDIDGQGEFVATESTTDAGGEAEAVIISQERGNTEVTATVTPCAPGGDCSDTSIQHWGPEECDIFGTAEKDTLEGTGADETICGFGGNDTIRGRGGKDKLVGSRGSDEVFGNGGNDRLQGGAGQDELHGGDGNDDVLGGGGADDLFGDAGNDDLDGGSGDDTCRGGTGQDDLKSC